MAPSSISVMSCTLLVISLVLLYCPMAQADMSGASELKDFWEHEYPGVAIPEALEKLASPLSSSSARFFIDRLKAGNLHSSKEFCSAARTSCASDEKVVFVRGPQPRVCIPPFFNYEYGVLPCRYSSSAVAQAAASNMFFTPDSLLQGISVEIPDTSNDLGGVTFLPESLASELPFDSKHLPVLSKVFGVTKGSDMELEMENTLAHCADKSQHEVTECQTSLEGMLKFATRTGGLDVVVLSPTAFSKQKAKVVNLHSLSSDGQRVISCHNMKFPSLVYSCHMTQTAQVLDVSLGLADHKVAHGLAICHLDTSYWNPTHISFEVLSTKPGKSTVCHWLPENSFIFVQQKGL